MQIIKSLLNNLLVKFFSYRVNVYSILDVFNSWFAPFASQQNERLRQLAMVCKTDIQPLFGVIPSLCPAQLTEIPAITKLDSLISQNHDQILHEVNILLESGYQGEPMNQFDAVQARGLGPSSSGWRPCWVRFLGTWSGVSDRLPTLKRICQQMDNDVWLLHVSVMESGTRLMEHGGVLQCVLRYHYPLQVPDNDQVGLTILGNYFRWPNRREGVCWDDCLRHSSYNLTGQRRILIFADVVRPCPWYWRLIHRLFYSAMIRFSHVKELQEKLAKNGKSI